MAQRNLTFNAPVGAGNQDNNEYADNPFVSPVDEEVLSYDSSNQRSSTQLQEFSRNQQLGVHNNTSYGAPFNTYNGYYSQNGTTSRLLSNENSSCETNNLTNNGANLSNSYQGSGTYSQNIQVPSDYDRYPSMAGSHVVSSTSLSSHFHNGNTNFSNSPSQHNKSDEEGSSSASSKSTNPFLQVTDFSPFGGYPALSFPLHIDEKEPDDYLHNPDPIEDAKYDKNRFMYDLKNIDKRSLGGLLGIIGLFLVAMVVFIVLPVLTYSGVANKYTPESYEILSNYQYPILSSIRSDLVDPDTPSDARTRKGFHGDTYQLVFSDEFNVEGRTFYEGDDQFFTAVDLNYGVTHDLEWYDPDAASTANGTLNLRMDAYKNHDLFYRSGMVQSWNKLCFTEGILEISARLPNYGSVPGLWPGLWSLGNLGRPGYPGSTEGVWPYTYDSCDAGITANQSSPDGISYLPGQRLNKCTCSGEDHPNPGVGRGAPEIDAIEAEVNSANQGTASQSLQVAPFDIWYMPDYNFMRIHNKSVTTVNTYAGGPLQQAVSGTTTLNDTWFEFGEGLRHLYQTYGFELNNDNDKGHLTWFVGPDPTLTIHPYALAPNGNIGWRMLPKEPLSLVLNLGISNNWAYIDWPSIIFPVTMKIDFVRIYQLEDNINLTCDPADYPTYDYIQSHLNLYENPNITLFLQGGYKFPKNTLVDGCSA